MKKSYICLLLLASISSVAFAAKNVAPARILIGQLYTDHVHALGYHKGQKPYRQYYISNGDKTHSLYQHYEGVCIHCAEKGDVVVMGTPKNHEFNYTGLNQHRVGESRHTYFFACSVCGEVTSDTYFCTGTGNGDCIPMAFPGAYHGMIEEAQ